MENYQFFGDGIDLMNVSRWKHKWWIPHKRSGRSVLGCAEGNEDPPRENGKEVIQNTWSNSSQRLKTKD